MALVTVRHRAGNWLNTFYSPPPGERAEERTVAALTLEDGHTQVMLGDGTSDVAVIAACLELEAALAEIRRQAQAHAALGWMDPILPDDVPLAETEARAAWGDR
jgi:hypothetical protein